MSRLGSRTPQNRGGNGNNACVTTLCPVATLVVALCVCVGRYFMDKDARFPFEAATIPVGTVGTVVLLPAVKDGSVSQAELGEMRDVLLRVFVSQSNRILSRRFQCPGSGSTVLGPC